MLFPILISKKTWVIGLLAVLLLQREASDKFDLGVEVKTS